ncbi:MAG: rod shape-determining protein RodA [Bacteroidota bacterium]|jgi:rod shape determining protein RodA
MISYIKEYFDYKTFLITCTLVLIGLLSIYSATFNVNNALNFYRQIIWGSIGLVIMLVVGFIPLRTVQRLSVPFYFLMLFILLIVLVIGITVKGSKRWLGVGGFGGQPSEFAKIATVLAFASYLSKTDVSLAHFKHFVLALLIFAAPMSIIIMQPDLGTTIVFFATLVPLLYWAGVSNFILVAIIVPIIVAGSALLGTTVFLIANALGAGLLYFFRENRFAAIVVFGITLAVGLSVQIGYDRLPLYQQKRIATFLNPGADLLGAGYNVVQSKIAIGSGGFLGKGYLKGTQTQFNYIPEHRTDFIFCVFGEEFGFIGSAIILLLFSALCLHGIRIATLSKNRFGSLAALGLTVILTTHAFVNIGMCMGSVPVIGIPLPFLSYGGSALVSNMMLSGLLMNFYTNRKEY